MKGKRQEKEASDNLLRLLFFLRQFKNTLLFSKPQTRPVRSVKGKIKPNVRIPKMKPLSNTSPFIGFDSRRVTEQRTRESRALRRIVILKANINGKRRRQRRRLAILVALFFNPAANNC
ncbi:hypothetical protein DQG23_19195 [Paenibacillus contaminans]|uniref:Uncharacterized protein n=1 Tax=Paenibacillus contaminans TaxID=450362 RepID=A0A329MLK1_9BACL|nr:hypothetical protein DQG23_19195 [Paenibacillus contaminans]